MPLTQQRSDIRTNVRRYANVQGTTALLRHPDADLNDYINRALGSLHRKLTASLPDQRYLASTTLTLTAGVSTYGLGVGFDSLLSLELTALGHKSWLSDKFEFSERPALTDSGAPTQGVPYAYRVEGSNIELLPIPQAAYTVLVWYLPTATQLSSDAATFDTISRLDDYLIAYAARLIAIKDKNLDLAAVCKATLDELDGEIAALARNVDRNAPPRIVDAYRTDRWGRGHRGRRGWR
jgi:hypothetical protein